MPSPGPLHVTNGDSTAGTLRQTSLCGEVVAWRDALHEGPVPAGTDDDVRRARARFLADASGLDEAAILAELESRDRALLDALGTRRDVVFWFEHDLYDQLQLVQALALVAASGVPTETLRLICVDGFDGRSGFVGLGELNARELESLWPRREPVARATVAAAAAAWDALRAPDPRALEAFAAAEPRSGLPFLAAALVRLLEELPAVGDGLARSERQVLEALAAGRSTPAELLLADVEAEEASFLGDTWLFARVDDLGRGGRPLVADGRTLTADGVDVLAGRLDRVELDPRRPLARRHVRAGPRPLALGPRGAPRACAGLVLEVPVQVAHARRVRLAARPERARQLVVAIRLVVPALLLERAAEAVVRVVVGRRELEHRAELGLRLLPALDPEVGDPERLADRGLVGLLLLRLLERHGRLRGHAPAEVVPSLLEEVVGVAHVIVLR